MLIITLGRQPALGLAELEAVFGDSNVIPLAGDTAFVQAESLPRELGGAIKVATLIDELPAGNFDKTSKLLAKRLSKYIQDFPDGKIKLGVSTYGMDLTPAAINRTSLYLKNALKRAGRSSRVVPNKDVYLSSAQVIHSGILSDVGLELVLVPHGDTILVGRTIHEQNIEAYADRDQARPHRDAFVGMLPPKLAQIMINLASGPEEADSRSAVPTLLDPFCGTGVVLQEAALYGYSVYGTDLSEKMVRYTRDNLNWLIDTRHIEFDRYYETADATTHAWRSPIDLVVCEGYLGQPLGGQSPDKERLAKIMHECNAIMRDFLKNMASQLKPGTPLCIAAPAWYVNDTMHHLPVIGDIESLGFSRTVYTHTTHDELVYRRENQTTGRELLVLKKK